MQITYRPLKPGDEAAYRHIHLDSLQTFPDNFGTRYEDQVKVEKLQFEEFIETGSQDNFIFGAFAGDDLIGIAGFRRGDREKTRHRGEIVQMYVDPDFHGQRVGESLMREVVEAAFTLTGIESLELSAVASNLSAQTLYEKIGFETYGIRSEYFKSGERYWDQRFMQLSKERYLNENHIVRLEKAKR
jgi:ribosomal protein S18 acetylase RimI-like enzyme